MLGLCTKNALRSAAILIGGLFLSTRAEAEASSVCWGKEATFEVLHSFVSGQDIPESVAFDFHGRAYISVGDTIFRREADGTIATYATLPLPIFALGVTVGPDGCVYTASTSLSEVEGAFVWRACEPGTASVYAELDPEGGPNDLVFDRWGNLYVTDPVLGRVWVITSDGEADVFVEHPLLEGNPEDPALQFRALGVNGIALDRWQRFLYLSNTDQGTILRVPLRASWTAPRLFAQGDILRGADGIAFDRGGRLLVAVNALDALVSVGRRGRIRVLGQGGLLDGPSSIAVAKGRWGARRTFVLSSAFSRTLGFQSGTPQPALLRMLFSHH